MPGLSNYPPGHPTGIGRGEDTVVFECEPCCRLIRLNDYDAKKLRLQVKHGRTPTCPQCGKPIARALCVKCDKPATHLDEDRAVNVFEPYCEQHHMGW